MFSPSVPGMNQKIRFTSGISTSSDSQPVVLKSWQRWMVSMKPTTMIAIQAIAIPAWPSTMPSSAPRMPNRR
ncbi:hypothetical protein D3C83_114630 [compost metagenome]